MLPQLFLLELVGEEEHVKIEINFLEKGKRIIRVLKEEKQEIKELILEELIKIEDIEEKEIIKKLTFNLRLQN